MGRVKSIDAVFSWFGLDVGVSEGKVYSARRGSTSGRLWLADKRMGTRTHMALTGWRGAHMHFMRFPAGDLFGGELTRCWVEPVGLVEMVQQPDEVAPAVKLVVPGAHMAAVA